MKPPPVTPDQLDTLIAANHKNIAKKLASGKTRSARESAHLDEMKRKTQRADTIDVPALAIFWRVHQQTVHRWVDAGHPVNDKRLMCDILGSTPNIRGRLVNRIQEVRAALGINKPADPITLADIELVN
ncbi:MAG: hypothetical protein EXS36_08885 [Pedosphaera sp.]|nr:hypothetical protein [Pedosphaera sp.]